MATLVLQTVGSALGTLVGGPVGGAIGSAIGSSLGSVVDQSLGQMVGSAGSSGGRRFSQGPRLKDLDGITATEGAAIPRLYGRARLGGQVIWATRFEEEAVYSTSKPRGGKGGIGGAAKGKASVEVSYRYYVNVAIGLCEGPVAFVRRVWADGKQLDLTTLTMRVHRGEADQVADPLIVAKQSDGLTPAYQSLAYVVFERLPLAAFGNRLPQFTFEVVRPVHGLCDRIRAINLIPGAGEYVYEPESVSRSGALGASSLPNRAQLTHQTNWHASMDALQALCPNLRHVALVVSWFGDDLRAGSCTIRPKTEPDSIDGNPYVWGVAGLTRADAQTVSLVEGKPAFGGTPSDGSVIRAIRDLKQRGLDVTLYPFVMMDIPSANALTDPWTGAASQAAYPWRGRITCDPAPGRPATADSTATADSQIAALVGTCLASHFATSGDSVVYSGPSEWTLRRLVLHTAALGQAAGGVEALELASELIGLTRVRGASAINPAVAALKTLAGEVRQLVGPSTKLTYGADWTEYGTEVRAGGADVRFPLDPLWADANIDAVAIDWYPPLTDWRDGDSHVDSAAYEGPYDQAMFADGLQAGEGYDWYYGSDAGRLAQTRLPISDGAYNKPWIYRPKDLVSWWSRAHYPRTGGVESTQATLWVPGSKPIWLLEVGCPAVDRGANGPNVFPDPKSSESAVPPFSRGMRDDLAQACHLVATLDHFSSAQNPYATLYAGRMVDPERLYLWAWDARPFPAFPSYGELWGDAANFNTGHWLNGRLEGMPLNDLIGQLLDDYGYDVPADLRADGFVDGYVLDRPMSVRAALEPLSDLFGFDARLTGTSLGFVRRTAHSRVTIADTQLALIGERDQAVLTRAQASELPSAITLGFVDAASDYRQAAVHVVVNDPDSQRDAALELGIVMDRALAQHRAGVMLNEARAARETISFALPPSRMELEVGDVVTLSGRLYRILRITDGVFRSCEAVAVAPSLYLSAPQALALPQVAAPRLPGPALGIVLDLPVADRDAAPLQYLAVTADPWPGAYTVWRSQDGASYEAFERADTRAIIGTCLTPLPAGPLWRSDRFSSVDVLLSHGTLQSITQLAALGGQNLAAIGSQAAGWEIIAFQTATLLGPNRWRLSGLLRGLGGSEEMAGSIKPAGSQIVLLDGALVPLVTDIDLLGRTMQYRLSPEGRDHADAMATSFQAIAGPRALLPLAPCRLRARREVGGISISWVRRTRFGGDSWELAEVPLSEATEAYDLSILAGTTLKRRLTVSQPTALYSTADETADFGTPQTNLTLRIRQISQAVGPGMALEAIVPVL
ncbi:MAG: baseplate multidomain protein megatron [Beijerinckiaceae bacterium]